MKTGKVFHVLIVEDNEPDRELILFFFKRCPIATQLHFAHDGVAAMDFVFKRGDFMEVPTPDLIILDLNLPVMNGHEVLHHIRNEKKLCHIPIVMMTTSTSPKEVHAAYCGGANAFISKLDDVEVFQNTINLMAAFWFQCVILPPKG